ncbi:MAG: hypothetical protein KAG56_09440, partial [Sulfurovaceae bacterium]|nr:hypothetical protein [Sulfurovaceae bacterium]
YKEKGIESIAFPLLGADKGGINQEKSLSIMKGYLDTIDIEVEIYQYDMKAKDDLYEKTKEKILSLDISEILKKTKLRKDYVKKITDALSQPNIYQLNQLARTKGVGIKTLEKLFLFANTTIK